MLVAADSATRVHLDCVVGISLPPSVLQSRAEIVDFGFGPKKKNTVR